MEFANLHWLWALLAVPLLAVGEWWFVRRDRERTSQLVARALWPRVVERPAEAWRWVRLALVLVSVAGLVLALARPRWGMVREKLERQGVDVVLVLDTSASMSCADVQPSRFVVARAATAALLDRLAGDRFALVALEGEAYPLVPLTLDADAVGLFLDTMEPGIVPTPGTSLGAGLARALDLFVDPNRANKVVILASDGEDLEGGLDEVIQKARQMGVVVHAIAVGTESGGPVPDLDRDGKQVGFKKDEDGSAVVSRLHPETLDNVARATGGRSVRVQPSQPLAWEIASAIDGMEQQTLAREYAYRKKERFQWPLAVAVVALTLGLLVPMPPLRRRKKLTASDGPAEGRGPGSEVRGPGKKVSASGRLPEGGGPGSGIRGPVPAHAGGAGDSRPSTLDSRPGGGPGSGIRGPVPAHPGGAGGSRPSTLDSRPGGGPGSGLRGPMSTHPGGAGDSRPSTLDSRPGGGWGPVGTATSAALVGVMLALAGVAGAQEPAQPKGSVVDEVLLKPTRSTSKGRSLYDEGNYPKALERFTDATQTRPSDARARFNLADALYKAGKLDEAGALFRALGEKDDAPLAFESRYNLGNVELSRQKFPDAVGAYRRALKLRQDDADTRRNLELALRAIEQQQKQEQQNQQNQHDQQDQQGQQKQQDQQGQQQDPNQQKQQQQSREQQERERFQREAGMPKEQAMQLLSALEQTEKDEQKRQLQALRAVRKKGKDW